jgi:hypothetical protein
MHSISRFYHKPSMSDSVAAFLGKSPKDFEHRKPLSSKGNFLLAIADIPRLAIECVPFSPEFWVIFVWFFAV